MLERFASCPVVYVAAPRLADRSLRDAVRAAVSRRNRAAPGSAQYVWVPRDDGSAVVFTTDAICMERLRPVPVRDELLADIIDDALALPGLARKPSSSRLWLLGEPGEGDKLLPLGIMREPQEWRVWAAAKSLALTRYALGMERNLPIPEAIPLDDLPGLFADALAMVAREREGEG